MEYFIQCVLVEVGHLLDPVANTGSTGKGAGSKQEMHDKSVRVGRLNDVLLLQERKKRGVDSEQIYLADVMAYQVCYLLCANTCAYLSQVHIMLYDVAFRASLKKLPNCTARQAKHPRYIPLPFIV